MPHTHQRCSSMVFYLLINAWLHYISIRNNTKAKVFPSNSLFLAKYIHLFTFFLISHSLNCMFINRNCRRWIIYYPVCIVSRWDYGLAVPPHSAGDVPSVNRVIKLFFFLSSSIISIITSQHHHRFAEQHSHLLFNISCNIISSHFIIPTSSLTSSSSITIVIIILIIIMIIQVRRISIIGRVGTTSNFPIPFCRVRVAVLGVEKGDCEASFLVTYPLIEIAEQF